MNSRKRDKYIKLSKLKEPIKGNWWMRFIHNIFHRKAGVFLIGGRYWFDSWTICIKCGQATQGNGKVSTTENKFEPNV